MQSEIIHSSSLIDTATLVFSAFVFHVHSPSGIMQYIWHLLHFFCAWTQKYYMYSFRTPSNIYEYPTRIAWIFVPSIHRYISYSSYSLFGIRLFIRYLSDYIRHFTHLVHALFSSYAIITAFGSQPSTPYSHKMFHNSLYSILL